MARFWQIKCKIMDMKNKVIGIEACTDYEKKNVRNALQRLLEKTEALDFVQPGMRVAIKTNLVSASAPEKAIVTHPTVLTVLTELLREKGAQVVIGDSPGGLFTSGILEKNYRLSGLMEAKEAGAELNLDVSVQELTHPQGKVMRSFTCTSWLLKADAVIDCCKLKTHGMMGMSANVKNMFGAIPGTMKPEYHFRFPVHEDFADMLVDINTAIKPCLYITDAVVGMEGNGPTGGTPRKIGALLASRDPYGLDVLCARLIGLEPNRVPTVAAAQKRGLCTCSVEDLPILGDWETFVVQDYEHVDKLNSLEFASVVPGFAMPAVRRILQARPKVKKEECIGCGKCRDICPAKAIRMEKKAPVVDTGKCIRCFCCQEFCPKGAMKVHRFWIARMLIGE